MAMPATRKAPGTEELSWRRPASTPTPASTTTTRGARTRARGGGRGGREVTASARPPASAAASARASPEIQAAAPPPKVPATESVAPNPGGSSSTRTNRRNSRAPPVPAVKIESSTPTTEVFATPSTPSSAKPSRRKRSQARNRTPSPVVAKTPSPTESTRSSVNVQPPPRSKQAAKLDRSKDVPPHLLPASHDGAATTSEEPNTELKLQVETLVEHMRAAVINRPTSPSTHIDWAGDEDDTLPDLDDWGYGSQEKDSLHPGHAQLDLISPILENSLKSLPLLEAPNADSGSSGSQTAVEDSVSAPPTGTQEKVDDELTSAAVPSVEVTSVSPTDTTSSRPRSPEKTKSRRGARAKAAKVSGAIGPSTQPEPRSKRDQVKATLAAAAANTKLPVALVKNDVKPADPLHPSLPSKPITSPQAKPASLPAKPITSPIDQPSSLPSKPSVETVAQSGTTDLARVSVSVTSPAALLNVSLGPEIKRPLSGLSASMHAPQPEDLPVSRSAPSDVATFDKEVPIRINGAATRPPPRNVRDRNSRPNSVHLQNGTASNAPAHSRTQSVPVTPNRRGPRAPGAARPVIAGSAISMLAKTLAGSPQRNASPSRT